ncbi:MAG: GNAT family N-acetyltransferase [Gammaproteobacteria bacterium]|nr:GNAT family N-acetyltransferase [Gammaproteobacteria bacterium]
MSTSPELKIRDSATGQVIDVQAVRSSKHTKDFIRLPWHIYADDPAWIPPLLLERRLHFSSLNPFFKHGSWQGWVAYINGKPVGRISAQIDELHRERYGQNTGHFGLVETIEDRRVLEALCVAAEAWLRERGATEISGPLGFSLNQECGVLVDGFEHPPVLMMPHSRPWYGKLLEEQGYLPAKDLLAYWVNVDFEPTEVLLRVLKRWDGRIKLRTLDRSRFSEEMELLRDLFNDAWSENWGFVPFTKAEFSELGTSLRLLVPDEFIQIAEFNGEAVAFIAALPNINELVTDLNGSLFPFGWLKLIWRIKKQRAVTGRVPLMGVRKKYQKKAIGSALTFLIVDAVRHKLFERGIKEVEMSWILENNTGMRAFLENVIECSVYKRYRLYHKTLTDKVT